MMDVSTRARAAFVVFAGFLFLALTPHASAQSEQDRRDCFSSDSRNYEDPNFYDIGLAACERFIQSRRYRGKDLAYYVRQKANWLHRKKDYNGALREFAYAIELDPNHVESYDYRADVFLDLGQYDRAIDEYNKAIRVDPDYPAAYYSRGRALEKLGKLDDAVASYKLSLEVPSKNRIGDWAHTEARKRLQELGR
ncbi:MAG: tetratricopeptide repeat protein [Xanthobacteraceae bacterium]|nr:tetratricopeptide repeat protein [Xanthobacteraceae bacterium]